MTAKKKSQTDVQSVTNPTDANYLAKITNGNDVINGTTKSERIDGLGGNDSILGLAGNDTLLGSAGNDTLNGGVGNDSLVGSTGNDSLIGDVGDDKLDGGTGNDVLDGGAGNDTLIGGTGVDTMIGGSGNDTYVVDRISDKVIEPDSSAAGGKDLVQSSVTFSAESIAGIENITLTGAGNINATGNGLNNILTGNKGNNVLNGGAGADTLIGDDGNDTLNGGDGADNLVGGMGSDTYILSDTEDTVTETKNGGTQDTIQTSVSFTLPNYVEVLKLLGTLDINGTGNTLSNLILGNTGNNSLVGGEGNDTLNGGAGNDTLDGGAGNNQLDGGDGNDTAIFSGTLSSYKLTEDTTSGTVTVKEIRGGASTQLNNIENIDFADNSLDISHGLVQNLALSVTDYSANEGNDASKSAKFILTLSAAPRTPITIAYNTVDGTALAGQDYVATSGSVIFGVGETSKTITVPILGDTLVESDEQFSVQFTLPDGVTMDNNEATATLVNDDKPTLSMTGTTVTEGNSGKTNAIVTVTLSNAIDQDVTVNYSTVNGTALSTSDYTTTAGTLTFAAGETTKTISVPVLGDTNIESDETFRVHLSAPTNATLDNTDATVTIINDDAVIPAISITAVKTIDEGNSGTRNAELTVNLSAATTQSVTVNYATANGTASAGTDYTATSGTLTFAPGETSKTISVPILGDTTVEANETLKVLLSTPVNGTLSSASTGVITINNDDVLPTLSIAASKAIPEGNSGSSNAEVVVTLSAPYTENVTVSYATSDGTATAGSDYTASTGSLSFAPGETSKTIKVPILGDTTIESDETFNIALSAPTNATLGNVNSSVVTISNDDLPLLSIADASVQEGNTGTTTNASATVTLSAPASQTVTVYYSTANASATAGSDYTASSGTLNFAPGETSKTISVPIIGDNFYEADETFKLSLSNPTNASLDSTASAATLTIRNDDSLPLLSIADSTVSEGNSGSHNANLTVTLSAAANQAVTVNYATLDGSATTADGDYTASTGILTFNAGETSKTISVPILGDTRLETDETLQVVLSNPSSNAGLGTSTGTLTISNDDLPVLSIANKSVPEGNSDSSLAELTVTLSAAVTTPVTVNYATQDGTATSGSDYTASTGTLTFNPGEISKTLTVPVLGDTTLESDETVQIALSQASSNAQISATAGTATLQILNDDISVTSGGNAEFKLDALPSNIGPDKATFADGSYVQVTGGPSVSYDKDTSTGGIHAQHYTATGQSVGALLLIDKYVYASASGSKYYYYYSPVVTALADGGFIVAGLENRYLYSSGVNVWHFDASDNLVGSRLNVAYTYSGLFSDCAVTALADGGFVVTYAASVNYGSAANIEGQRYDAHGAWSSSLSSLGSGTQSSVAGLADGGFVVSWTSGSDIYAQRYDDLGAPANSQFRVNTTLIGDQSSSFVRSLPDGGFMISWTSDGSLYAQRYDAWGNPDQIMVSTGTGVNDHLSGVGEHVDSLLGLAGNDTLEGGAGTDTLTGGAGNDSLDGGSDADTLIGGAGVDTMTGGSGDDLFVFNLGDSGVGVGNRDVITDFDHPALNERIDLHNLANLSFIGTANFYASNQVRYLIDNTNNDTLVQVNLDSNTAAPELEIELTGVISLTNADFVLS
jgi:Ca2+-binding RTX toxin-like protein